MSAIEYNQRAEQYRPMNPEALAAEIRRMVDGGLRPRDVAAALRIGLPIVLQAMQS
jgi:hypothetical protein